MEFDFEQVRKKWAIEKRAEISALFLFHYIFAFVFY